MPETNTDSTYSPNFSVEHNQSDKILFNQPVEAIFDKPLTPDQYHLLEEQYRRHQQLSNEVIYNQNLPSLTPNGKLFLNEGTLIHGYSCAHIDPHTEEVLTSISQYGILASEFLGKYEDAETFYCADFFRVPMSQSLSEYSKFCIQYDQYGPKIEKSRLPNGNFGIAFIVEPNTKINDLLSYDPYRNNGDISDKMRQIVDWENVQDSRFPHQRLSAILYGVPSSCIAGIWVGNVTFNKENNIDIIKHLFPQCYITNSDGDVIHPITTDNSEKTT